MKDYVLKKIHNKESKIGIIGMGYVGIPLMLRFIAEGFTVYGLDIDKAKVDMLNDGKSFIEHIPNKDIQVAKSKQFIATLDFSVCGELDILILCVPTPLSAHREPDISYILDSLNSMGPYIKRGHVISLESTTYPGTTDEVIVPFVQHAGLSVGRDVFVLYSPEREDPGNKNFNTKTIPKVCGGITSECLEVGVSLYKSIIDSVVPVSSARAAEMTKLLENIHRAVNIGLVNEMKVVADKMSLDIHEIIRAAATKPFGFVPYYPGPGLGGHCIPIDPFYLTWKAREYGVHTRFIELAGEINSSMPDYVLSKVIDALNRSSKSIRGSKILILGVAYKKNLDDIRESPSLALISKLTQLGSEVIYYDPFIPILNSAHDRIYDLKSIKLDKNIIENSDCVLLATDHDCFDYKLIEDYARIIVDTRGRFLKKSAKIIKA
jgi:UDP-N-acetyl-D-glucosamine dehydrogenase